MRRTRGLVGLATLTLVGAGLTVSGEVAAAGVESCHGQPATIAGTPGSDLRGTDGPDVIVTNGAADTYAGDGDDLVCVTGGDGMDRASVLVDEGDDVVDASASEADRVDARLGPGTDTFTGGPGGDQVDASDPWDSPRHQGADAVDTGSGDDWVTTGGAPGEPDHDAIDLGPGDDGVQLDGPVDPELPIRGGEGADEVTFDRSTMRRAWVIDNATGQATHAGEPVVRWDGMESFRLTPWGAWVAPSFIGGEGPEKVFTVVPLTSLDLGGGDDRVNLDLHTARLVDEASYTGGEGDDTFVLYAGAGDQARRVDLDLVDGRLLFRPAQEPVRAQIHEFERYRLSAWRLDVRGTAATDEVLWLGCRGVVAGGAGDDLLEAFSVPDAGCGYLGEDAEAVARGGPGDDILLGDYLPDILIGGPGVDVANGRRNDDRCVAETMIRCELTPP